MAQVDVDGIGFSDVTARLSPNGSMVAFRVTGDRQGGSSLYALDVASGKPTLVSSTRSTAEGISAYMWSPGGGALAFTRISPAPYPHLVDDRYGRVYVYAGGQANPLGASHGSDRLLGFAGDGKGVYVSRLENFLGNSLEHLVYLPLSGGEGITLIRSRMALRYSQFAVWARPGYPAKVAALAEGDFSLALPPSPKTPPTDTPAPDNPGRLKLAQEPTEPAATSRPILEATIPAPPEPAPEASSTVPTPPSAENQPPTPDPLNRIFAGETPLPDQTVTLTPEASPTQEDATPTATDTATPTATETPTPVPTGVISRAPISGRLSKPNGLGVIVSDPAGTMPVLLRRDAEAFPYLEWSGDGAGIMMGGTPSGAAWGLDLNGGKRALDANLRDLRAVHWVGGDTVILADNPVSRLVTLNFRSGGSVGARGVGVVARSGQPAMRLGVPYIHQVNDTAQYSNGSWACGPTSVAMTLAYYGKLLPWGQYVAEQEADETGMEAPPRSQSRSLDGKDYAPYITNGYAQNGRSYTVTARDASGRPVSGLYGTICPTGLASWQMIQSVLASHGLGSNYVPVTWDGVVGALKRGHPVILGNELTAAGHILVVIGYTPDGSLLVHDPFGNRFESGYGGNYGGGVLYQWKRATARRALEVIGVYPPPPPGPRPTRTPTPLGQGADATPTITPLPGIIEATPIPFDTPTISIVPAQDKPIIFVGTATLEPPPAATLEATPSGELPATEPPRSTQEPTPTLFGDPESFFYTLPLLLSALTVLLFRRVTEKREKQLQ